MFMSVSREDMALPCTMCCGSSFLPGSPRQPMSSSMGMLYTLGSASERRGFTLLPKPLFCMYTTGKRRVARWYPVASPMAAPSLAVMTCLDAGRSVADVGAEVLEEGVGHAAVEVEPLVEEGGVEVLGLEEVAHGLGQGSLGVGGDRGAGVKGGGRGDVEVGGGGVGEGGRGGGRGGGVE